MKKILLALTLFAGLTTVKAQILNNDFENWSTQTAYFNGFNGFFHPDTFLYSDPVDWTTTNQLSGADTFGNVFFVTQSNSPYSGSSAMKLVTDTLKTVGTPLGARKLTIPGMALNGAFPLNISQSILLGGTLSPAAVPGAGTQCTQRLLNFKGYYNYTPVFNDSTGNMDSCIIWVTLRKGSTEVANAIWQSSVNTAGWAAFSAPFNYVSCEMPDTITILVASSVPNFSSVLSGYTKLVRGSVLLVDSFSYDTLPANYNFKPIARNDADTTVKNVAKDISIKLNDDDCNDGTGSLTIAVTTQPSHGTATVGTGVINYSPATDYVGLDNFYYTLNDGVNTSDPAKVNVVVLQTSGINETNVVPVSVYPVPAKDVLNVRFDYSGKASIKVYDMVGNLLSTNNVNSNNTAVSTEGLASGVYVMQITDARGATLARTKFTVSK